MRPLAALLVLSCATTANARPVPGTQHVTFPSRDGDLRGGHPTQLEGWLFRPSGPGPFPAIVALHGCAGPYAKGGSLMARDREWADRLRDLGFVVLLPDSFNPRGVSEICSRGERAIRAGWERSRDAYGALVYLQTLAFVRAERIGLLGWSNGAIAVLYTMAASWAPRRSAPIRPREPMRSAVFLGSFFVRWITITKITETQVVDFMCFSGPN